MDGSAAVIGEMMLPILEPLSPEALGPARDLGNAFQLTNFLRDINEDLDLGRVYVPQHDIRRFGAESAFAERRVTPAFVALMSFEIDRARELYASADRGVTLLPPSSARCIAAARALYSRILDVIEANDYDVFSAASVSAHLEEGRRRRLHGRSLAALARPKGSASDERVSLHGARPFPQRARDHREQEAVRLSRPQVVDAVGFPHALERSPPPRERRHATVDVEIVHEQVTRAVERDARTHPREPRQRIRIRAERDHDDGDRGTHQRIEIVGLERGGAHLMMAAMPRAEPAVHHEPMDEVGSGLHQHERNEHEDHGHRRERYRSANRTHRASTQCSSAKPKA